MRSTIAVLVAKQERQDADMHDIKRDVRKISNSVVEMASAFKVLKWAISVAVTIGPAIGVGLAKLLQV